MNTDARLLLNSLVALAPTDDGYLAYDTARNELHRLNAAAALIIELCDGIRTTDAVVSELAPLVSDADARTACARWIESALENNLLKQIPNAASESTTPSPEYFSKLASRLRSEGHVLAAFVCQHHATMQMVDDANQWAALGELAHIIGRRDDAREAYEQYVRLAPGDAEVEHILVSLRGDPTPSRAPDECILQLYARFAEYYERSMRQDLEYCGPEVLADALQRELGAAKGLDVLELGCGTGLAGRYLRSIASRLVGIDLSPEMAKRASATGFYDAVDVAEITAWLGQCDRDFDLIAACDTLIYFGDLRQVILPAAQRLRTRGRIAFTVERGERAPFELTDSGRYVHTESHVRDVAADGGFDIARLETTVLRYEYGEPVRGLVVVLRRR